MWAVEEGRHGESVKDDVKFLDHDGQYSEICGGTSYMGQTSDPSLVHISDIPPSISL